MVGAGGRGKRGRKSPANEPPSLAKQGINKDLAKEMRSSNNIATLDELGTDRFAVHLGK
jgi:hypothetical protein